MIHGHDWYDDLHQLFFEDVSQQLKITFFSSSPFYSLPCFFFCLFFFSFRENILKTAKALVEDTKLLVSGAASSQDKLAQAAQSSANTITQLAEVVKLGAASLGSDDPETQVRCLKVFLVL